MVIRGPVSSSRKKPHIEFSFGMTDEGVCREAKKTGRAGAVTDVLVRPRLRLLRLAQLATVCDHRPENAAVNGQHDDCPDWVIGNGEEVDDGGHRHDCNCNDAGHNRTRKEADPRNRDYNATDHVDPTPSGD